MRVQEIYQSIMSDNHLKTDVQKMERLMEEFRCLEDDDLISGADKLVLIQTEPLNMIENLVMSDRLSSEQMITLEAKLSLAKEEIEKNNKVQEIVSDQHAERIYKISDILNAKKNYLFSFDYAMESFKKYITEEYASSLGSLEEAMALENTEESQVIQTEALMKVSRGKLLNSFYNFMTTSDENEMISSFQEMEKCTSLMIATEQSVAKRTAVKLDQKGQKAINDAKRKIADAGGVANIAKQVPKRLIEEVSTAIDKVKMIDKRAEQKSVIEGGVRRKMYKLIRGVIVTIAAGGVGLIGGPTVATVLASITALQQLATSVRSEQKVRIEVAHELEAELKIVREKIKDASNNNDNKAKYQLMRIENAIEKSIRRIKTGKTTNALMANRYKED